MSVKIAWAAVVLSLVVLVMYGFMDQLRKEAQLRSLEEDSFIMDVLIFRVEHCSQQPLKPMMQDVCAEAERVFDESVQRRKALNTFLSKGVAMTLIVGIIEPETGRVIMCADSAGSNTYLQQTIRADKKLFVKELKHA